MDEVKVIEAMATLIKSKVINGYFEFESDDLSKVDEIWYKAQLTLQGYKVDEVINLTKDEAYDQIRKDYIARMNAMHRES